MNHVDVGHMNVRERLGIPADLEIRAIAELPDDAALDVRAGLSEFYGIVIGLDEAVLNPSVPGADCPVILKGPLCYDFEPSKQACRARVCIVGNRDIPIR